MELVLLDLLFAQELINDVLGYVKALRLEAELSMNIDNPFQEERTRCVPDLCLHLRNILRVDHELDFL